MGNHLKERKQLLQHGDILKNIIILLPKIRQIWNQYVTDIKTATSYRCNFQTTDIRLQYLRQSCLVSWLLEDFFLIKYSVDENRKWNRVETRRQESLIWNQCNILELSFSYPYDRARLHSVCRLIFDMHDI